LVIATNAPNKPRSHEMTKTLTQTDAEKIVNRVLSEDVLSIAQAQRELKKIINQRIDRSTIIRWIHRGCGGVKLDAVKVGNQLATSTQALNRFIVARTAKIAS
jgi:ribosome maturation protein Sdo1